MSKWARMANNRGRKVGDFKMIQGTRTCTGEEREAALRAARGSIAPLNEPPLQCISEQTPLNEISSPRVIASLGGVGAIDIAPTKPPCEVPVPRTVKRTIGNLPFDWFQAVWLMRRGYIVQCNNGWKLKLVENVVHLSDGKNVDSFVWHSKLEDDDTSFHLKAWAISTFKVVS